jgi:superfamily I DNA/RNA helicase
MDDQTFFSAIEQLSSTDGHVRVLGPPGSGKTSTLLERFKNLEKDGSRGQIAVVTYTRESRESLLS